MTQRNFEEWKISQENARHFNDLLVRFRAFGIPIVVTIFGAGVAFGPQIILPTIPVMWASILSITLAIIIPIYFWVYMVPAARMGTEIGPTWLEGFAAFAIFITPIAAFGLTAWQYGLSTIFGDDYDVTYPAAVAIVGFALALLAGIYVMDRFYYYRLLIGAVIRSEELERKLGFSLTAKISYLIPRRAAKEVISGMYFLPGFLAVAAILTLGYIDLWTKCCHVASPETFTPTIIVHMSG